MSGEEYSFIEPIEMAVFDLTTLTGTYQVLNGAAQQPATSSVGFEDDIKILKIYNDGDQGVTLSFDSVKRGDYIPAKGTFILDCQANHATNSAWSSGMKYGRKGQKIYGRGTASTSGNLYIAGYR